MSTSAALDPSLQNTDAQYRVATLTIDRPWYWLAAATRDIASTPFLSLGYGFVVALLSLGITLAVIALGQIHWMLPLLCGFMLVGPMVAVGLYQISRRLESRDTPTLRDTLLAWRSNPTQLGLMGLVLGLSLLFWFRIATLLFALFVGGQPVVAERLVADLISPGGGALLAVGAVCGALFALMTYAVSVISIPMLLDRPVSFMEAAIASATALARNPATLMLWGAIITALVIAGLATLYIGLVVILPLVGHASWHAYRDLVITTDTTAARV